MWPGYPTWPTGQNIFRYNKGKKKLQGKMLRHCSFDSFLENRTLLLRHTVEKMPRKSYMYFSSHFFFGLRGGIKQEPRSDKSLKTDGLWEPLEKTIQLETTGDSIAEFSFCRCQIRWAKIAFSTLFFFSLWLLFSLDASGASGKMPPIVRV